MALADIYAQFLISYACAIVPSGAAIAAGLIVALTSETAYIITGPLIDRFGVEMVSTAQTVVLVLVVWNRARSNEAAQALVTTTRADIAKAKKAARQAAKKAKKAASKKRR